jgi:hypothetical protein
MTTSPQAYWRHHATPATTVSYIDSSGTPDGQQSTAATVVTSTDWMTTAIAVSLQVLSVASFVGAGWQIYRRRRWEAQR